MVGFGPTLWSTPPRRDRVRHQGDPARRLHPDDRHVPAAARRRPGHHAGVEHRPVHPARRRGPPAEPRGDQARRRGPRLLQAVGAQEGRRHARRPGDEPRHRRRAAHRLVTLYGVADAAGRRRRRLGQRVRRAGRARPPPRPTCAATDPKTPAFAAGIRPGDSIVSIAGQPIERTADVGKLIRPRVGEADPDRRRCATAREQTLDGHARSATPSSRSARTAPRSSTPTASPWSSTRASSASRSAPVDRRRAPAGHRRPGHRRRARPGARRPA